MYGNRLAGKQAHYSRTTGSPVLEPWEGGWSDVHPLRETEDEHQNAMEEDGLSWIFVEDPVKRVEGNMTIVWGVDYARLSVSPR